MLRVICAGGIGNQLFQYVAARRCAKRLGVGLEIDTRYYDEGVTAPAKRFWLDTLPIVARVLRYPRTPLLSGRSVPRRAYRRFIEPLFRNIYIHTGLDSDPRFYRIVDNTVIFGWFQSLYFVAPRDEEIMSEVSLWEAVDAVTQKMASEISGLELVSVHVRRGDYVGNSQFEMHAQHTYLEAAMSYMRRQLARAKFLVFSDDIEWCKNSSVFGLDCEFMTESVDKESPAVDLLLISKCRHHILTNSSFSWWGAWIDYNREKCCVMPRQWIRGRGTGELGLVCPGWITL